LVEQDDAVLRRVVEAAHLVGTATARAAVQQHHRLAIGIAALLVIEDVAVIDAEGAGVEGFDLGIQRAHADAASCGITGPVYQPGPLSPPPSAPRRPGRALRGRP